MLPFDSAIILENDRVKLSPLQKEHIADLKEYSISEPTLWQYSLVNAAGEKNMIKYIDLAISKRAKKDSYAFVVFDKKTQKIAGSTRFYDYKKTHSTVQLGYTWYGKSFWGTGLNTNCKFLMLSYTYEVLNLERVEFRADNNNARSIAAMKKLGCTQEGILRSNCAAGNGARRDSIILSILKEEWESSIKQNLEQRLSQ